MLKMNIFNIMHLLTKKNCSTMKLLLRMSSVQLRNISSSSNKSSDIHASNIITNNLLLCGSTSFPNNIEDLITFNTGN